MGGCNHRRWPVVDLGIIGKPGVLDVGVDAGLNGARRQAWIGGFEIVGLGIGPGLLGGNGALADGDDAGAVAGVHQIDGDARIGRFEGGLHDVGPEIVDVRVRAGVPVDDPFGCRGHARQDQRARRRGRRKHEFTPFHRSVFPFCLGAISLRRLVARWIAQQHPQPAYRQAARRQTPFEKIMVLQQLYYTRRVENAVAIFPQESSRQVVGCLKQARSAGYSLLPLMRRGMDPTRSGL